MKGHYSTGEFAKLTGVSVRTLQYYDDIGLLKASRSDGDRRYYDDSHFITMQKIVTLKFLGFTLVQIKELLAQDSWNLKESLEIQKILMEDKLLQIQNVLKTLDHAIQLADEKERIDAGIFISIIQGVQYEDKHREWLNDVLPVEKVEDIFSIPKRQQQEMEKKFMLMLTELKNKTGTDPKAEEIQQLVKSLMEMFEDIVGEDIHSFYENLDEEQLEEEDPLSFLPFETNELEWIREAIQIFLETDRGKGG